MEPMVRGKFPLPVERNRVAGDWEARGYDCRPFVDPPGREWNDFVHDTNELVTVVEGTLLCRVGNDPLLRLEAGDELFIPRRARHSVKNVYRGTTRWLFGYD